MKFSRSTIGVFSKLFFISLVLVSSNFVAPQIFASKNPFDTAPFHCNDCSPTRIILNLTQNPWEDQAVTWRSCCELKNPEIQIVSVAASPNLQKDLKTVPAVIEKVDLETENHVYYYSVVVRHLKPDTLYAYRVGADNTWSEWNQFRTAGKNQKSFSFIYLGDVQNNVKSMCSRIFRAAYQKAPLANFWFFVGDLVNNGDKDREWDEFFSALDWIPRTTPMILLPGNHEYPSRKHTRKDAFELFHLWRPQFTLPENGPGCLKETTYFIDFQGAKFVMLNGNEKFVEQANWLDKVLTENTQTWTVVGIHQPFYSSGRHRKNSRLRDLLIPILDKHAVDLVLQGHDHIYCRSYKLRNGKRVAPGKKGTVYVVSICGPKFYDATANADGLMAKIETGRQLFQLIHVGPDRLLFESFDAMGVKHDSFSLQKNPY